MQQDDPTAYHNVLPSLGFYYFEDSFVLGVRFKADTLIFDMELVLTEQHPLWRMPPSNERHCYRRGELVFEGASDVNWSDLHFVCPETPVDEWDFGEMDALSASGNKFEAEGGWGKVSLSARNVHVRLA